MGSERPKNYVGPVLNSSTAVRSAPFCARPQSRNATGQPFRSVYFPSAISKTPAFTNPKVAWTGMSHGIAVAQLPTAYGRQRSAAAIADTPRNR